MQYITLHHFGPICDHERLPIEGFTVLTGPQAQGKSTIAKAIFFFQTILQDFFEQLTQRKADDVYRSSLQESLNKRLRSKFLRIFGSSRAMPFDMKIIYQYSAQVAITMANIGMDEGGRIRNFVNFQFSDGILDFLAGYENYEKIAWDGVRLKKVRDELTTLFGVKEKPIYIPAGRSMLALLTAQLPVLYADDTSRRAIDFCIYSYMAELLRLRQFFHGGLSGLLEDKLDLSQKKIDKQRFEQLMELAEKVLKGKYVYDDGEEIIIFKEKVRNTRTGQIGKRYINVDFASSGQQEAVWVFNLLGYYLLEKQPVFLLVEEPEAHLYPDSQKYIAEALALFAGAGNRVMVTTHSPYILGEFNNLLYANEVQGREEQRNKIVAANKLLPHEHTQAFYVKDGEVLPGMEEYQIMSSLIDGASREINQEYERLIDMKWAMGTDHGN